MFGKSSFESFKPKGPTPEEILAAQRAADIANREKTERQLKERTEHEETLRLARLHEIDAAEKSGKLTGGRWVIGDAESAEKEMKDPEETLQ